MFPKNIIAIFIAFIITRTSVSAADSNITELLENINYLNNFGDTRIEVAPPAQVRFVPVTKKGCVNVWVKTDNEAQIILSNSAQYTDPRIKIIIGGWANAASAVVINENWENFYRVDTPGILKLNESQGFWVMWSTDGDVLVGKMNERYPFMVYKHEPTKWYPINFVGVLNTNTGSWIIKDQHKCDF